MVVASIPYDGGMSFRKGAAGGSKGIRSVPSVAPPTTEYGEDLRGLVVDALGARNGVYLSIDIDVLDVAYARGRGRRSWGAWTDANSLTCWRASSLCPS